MGRFYGKVGFGQTVEVRPGVMEDVITEKNLYGDVLRPSQSFQEADKVHLDISMGNRISVVADEYTWQNSFAIRYVEYKGIRWYITNIVEERPRLIFSLGEVYNGPVPATDDSDDET
jgi:hypothetical protein